MSAGRPGKPRLRARWLRELLRRPTGIFGAIVVALVLLAALVSLFWTPHPLLEQSIAHRWEGPSLQHWLGTDQIGRDTFSWLLAGARTTVVVAASSVLITGVIGIGLGALTALTPRGLAEPLIVLVDILIAFPILLIALLLASTFGGSLVVVVIAVGIGFGVNMARVTRPEIRRVDNSEFVLAARAAGVGRVQTVLRHIVPNVAPIVIVQLSLVAATSILAEAGLSYLGYGAPSGTPSWGRSLADSQTYITVQPASVLWPGLTIAITVLALSLLGDALREALDPRLGRRVDGADLVDAEQLHAVEAGASAPGTAQRTRALGEDAA